MSTLNRDELQTKIHEIRDRVEINGRDSEIVSIRLDITLKGQSAVNYKVLRLFANELNDNQFINLIYLLGQKNGTEIIKLIAPEHGIQL